MKWLNVIEKRIEDLKKDIKNEEDKGRRVRKIWLENLQENEILRLNIKSCVGV